MKYEDIVILIPSHSLEDFPTDLPDREAFSLLNAFVVPWHPLVLDSARVVPRWHRADDPPQLVSQRLVMVPRNCRDRVPAGWVERARSEGAVVVTDGEDRDALLQQALGPLGSSVPVPQDLVDDFFALGFAYIQVELLSRHMRHFGTMDEVQLQKQAVLAAEAAVAREAETARTHLRQCFEMLTESRERFYPVECYLLDLCLLIPRLANAAFAAELTGFRPFSVLVSGQDLEEIARDHSTVVPLLREACDRRLVSLVGGEYREAPVPLLPLGSVLWQLRKGRQVFRDVLGRAPQVWGRRRYGLAAQLPQILQRSGYQAGLHLAMDDGLYPDQEYSKIRWEGTNQTALDACSRIPLAAEGAAGYLRFPVRMSESMDHDQVACVLFARWPEVKSPFFHDLCRMHRYGPVLGRWMHLDEFFERTESPGRTSSYDPSDYLAPFLVQAVARELPDPVSRFAGHFQRRARLDAARWCAATRALILGQPAAAALSGEVEALVEAADPDAEPAAVATATDRLDTWSREAARGLGEVILHGADANAGYLVLNPLSFPRKVIVPLAEDDVVSPGGGPVEFVQDTGGHPGQRAAVVQVPGCGFAWVPRRAGGASAPAGSGKVPGPAAEAIPLAEPHVLRNEFFELRLNPDTGGIMQWKGWGRAPNRLSQQLAYRFPRERTVPGPDPAAAPVQSYYSEMRCTDSQVRCSGPTLGEVLVTGELVDQTNQCVLAHFQQTYRVWRGRPVVEIETQLVPAHLPDGDPWTNYYACRWAWNDSTAAITRDVLSQAQGIKEPRIEAPQYLEFSVGNERTTILTHGLAFHRKTGDRRLDTLLLAAGETCRRFQFTLAFDQPYPMQAALDALSPPLIVPTTHGPPRGVASGWLFHVDARNVLLLQVLGVTEPPPMPTDAWATPASLAEPPAAPGRPGALLRLVETEGRAARVNLGCFRAPKLARQRDLEGRIVTDLTLRDDHVTVDLTAFEIADIEVVF